MYKTNEINRGYCVAVYRMLLRGQKNDTNTKLNSTKDHCISKQTFVMPGALKSLRINYISPAAILINTLRLKLEQSCLLISLQKIKKSFIKLVAA